MIAKEQNRNWMNKCSNCIIVCSCLNSRWMPLIKYNILLCMNRSIFQSNLTSIYNISWRVTLISLSMKVKNTWSHLDVYWSILSQYFVMWIYFCLRNFKITRVDCIWLISSQNLSIKSLLSPLPGTNQFWCYMRNRGCNFM